MSARTCESAVQKKNKDREHPEKSFFYWFIPLYSISFFKRSMAIFNAVMASCRFANVER